VIRIVIADDHPVVRSGLRALLQAEPDLDVVAEAASASEALEKAVSEQADVAILDLKMPGGGSRAIQEIGRRCPACRTIVLSMFGDAPHLRSALALGVSGYVIKNASIGEVADAVRTVHRGRTYVSSSLRDLANEILQAATTGATSTVGAGVDRLSSREREVLALSAHGYTAREIAEKLGISAKTAETYRGRVGEKLGLTSRADLVRFALDAGILDLYDEEG